MDAIQKQKKIDYIPGITTYDELIQMLPKHIDASEVILIEDIIQDKEKITIEELCNQSGIEEEKI